LPGSETIAGATRQGISAIQDPPDSYLDATILIVEDEDPIRQAVVKILRRSGFAVLEASNGSSAIDVLHTMQGKIDLLLLDLTIPGTSSREVAAEAVKARPDIRVILTSAYSQETIPGAMNLPQIRTFIRKPFQLGDLVRTLRNSLSA
jgi:DNA-binding NtrC family response regulator